MNSTKILSGVVALGLLSASTAAQHAQVSAVRVNPNDSSEVWACNRDNNSVAVVDTDTAGVTEIAVGVKPRSLAFSSDGSKVFVANQRGDIPVDVNFVTPFTGSEIRSSVSVIDVSSKTVTDTILDVGTEPYGVAVAPNGEYFAVSGFRSGTIKFYDADTHALLHTHQYLHTLNAVPVATTMADVDSDDDMLADCGEPRAFVIKSDSATMYVTHLIPGYVSVLSLTLDLDGKPIASTVSDKINLNDYVEHPILNPVPVQTVASAGTPRFLQDIALSPSGNHALVPHLLHNINHDVNHDFGGAIAGDFANRVYPALTIVDASQNSWNAGGDDSGRLHHEIADPLDPAGFIPFGEGKVVGGSPVSFGGNGEPTLGSPIEFVLSGPDIAGAVAAALFSTTPVEIDLGAPGTLYCLPGSEALLLTPQGGGLHTLGVSVPNAPVFQGLNLCFQGVLVEPSLDYHMSNGLTVRTDNVGYGSDKMGHRAGHPGRVLYNAAGDRAVMLNRGSEDVFLYEVNGSSMSLMTVFPPRHNHVERDALDTTTPMGDLPLGMALVEDAGSENDDALLYVINESTRTLSTLRIDWDTGEISKEADQISTLTGADEFTASEILGQEIFEDSSRAQTAGRFNNSCASCHFEGGADGNIWQRPAGPRTTMPVYGGTLGTGLILWKGVRLNMGETGPMFGGENGGTGVFTDIEQQALTDYHEVIPVPLNPNLDPLTGAYSTTAALGKDLYFGTNDTGLNPTGRHAGCAECHPDEEDVTLEARLYTADHLDPLLTSSENLENIDPFCFSLQENIVALNIRNVNSGVNVDSDNDGFPDPDRNADGINDLESYSPMNVDDSDDFTRDDPNGYLCPQDPIGDPMGPQKVFTRPPELFSIPTKLGAYSTGPYFHDHVAASLRTLLDPQNQQTDLIYGNANWPEMGKFVNEFHDLRGSSPILSKVQINLQSTVVEADIEAILEYIRSL